MGASIELPRLLHMPFTERSVPNLTIRQAADARRQGLAIHLILPVMYCKSVRSVSAFWMHCNLIISCHPLIKRSCARGQGW